MQKNISEESQFSPRITVGSREIDKEKERERLHVKETGTESLQVSYL